MIGKVVALSARDGHELSAYEPRPNGMPRGGLVLLQEIFGVTGHIRRVCDGYSAKGYHVVAPALFDRIRPGTELGYSREEAATGRDLHCGEIDPIATPEHAGQLRAAHGAGVEIEVYPASHGFNCDEIANFHQPSAARALRRSFAFLAAHVG
jgi:dienelactone hydrolase